MLQLRYRDFNKLLIVVSLLVGMSVLWDVIVLIDRWPQKSQLKKYITFEEAVIAEKKQLWIKRIETSIKFKSEDQRNKLSSFMNLESKTLDELEKQILTLHTSIGTLDSLPYGNSDIIDLRKLMNASKSKDIKGFYEQLLMLSMFERLASDVYADSDDAISEWTIIRPKTEDSTYIGAQFYPDGRSKYAYYINNMYFRGQYTGGLYTVSKIDTLNIKTLSMVNNGTYIDTQYNEQHLVFNRNIWKNIGM